MFRFDPGGWRQRDYTRSNRRGGAARGPAGRSGGVPWVAGGTGKARLSGGQDPEFRHRRSAYGHESRFLEPLYGSAVMVGDTVLEEARADAHGQPLLGRSILYGDRYASERTRIARRNPFGFGECPVGVHETEGAYALLTLLDSTKSGLDELPRAHPPECTNPASSTAGRTSSSSVVLGRPVASNTRGPPPCRRTSFPSPQPRSGSVCGRVPFRTCRSPQHTQLLTDIYWIFPASLAGTSTAGPP
jgi:hypothetical protein